MHEFWSRVIVPASEETAEEMGPTRTIIPGKFLNFPEKGEIAEWHKQARRDEKLQTEKCAEK